MLLKYPLLSRLASKVLYELLPAAIASAVGGMLYSHYARPPVMTPETAIAAPASVEMMQMVRDEHALIVDYLKKHAEQAELAAMDAWRLRAARRAAMLAVREARMAQTGL